MTEGLETGRRVLVVRNQERRWAVPLGRAVHAGPLERLTRLPNAPPALIGVTEFFGDIVPVYDLTLLLPASPGGHPGADDEGMLLLVRQGGQVAGLRVSGIEEIRSLSGVEADLLDIDTLSFPILPGRRGTPGHQGGHQGGRQNAAEAIASGTYSGERLLEARLAGQTMWLALPGIVEVLDGFAVVMVPWADPRVPAVVIRGGSVLPVVRVDLLLDARAEGGAEGQPMDGPLVVVRRAAGLMAFWVDRIVGIVPRTADRPVLELDTLLAVLPGGNAAIQGPGAAGARVAAGAAAGESGRAYLSFVLAGQPCLLPMAVIRAVAEHVRPAVLPGVEGESAKVLTGLRAIRGQILPVVDPRRALGLAGDGVPAADIIVAAAGWPPFVVPAQSVDGVVRLADAAVHETGRRAMIGGVAQVGGRLAWLLAPGALAGSPKGAPATSMLQRRGLRGGA